MNKDDNQSFRIDNIKPILTVSDMNQSLAFYIDILGFKKADWGDENFTGINRDNTELYLCKNGQGFPGTWIMIGFEGDIFSLHQTLKSKGVKINLPPTNFYWAYEMRIEDPDGHILRFGTDPDEKTPFVES
jgi:catechol 2,3-dioxygenase-like lactoylglutathione lyase family enzyme